MSDKLDSTPSPNFGSAKELYSSAILAAGVTTPPQKGNPPYPGYETGLWGTTRRGIGAVYFPPVIPSPVTFDLIDREYLIEPDVNTNTTTGLAVFTQGSNTVTGISTAWLTHIVAGDVIQLNSYQKYFTIASVINNTTLTLTSNFDSSTTTGFYTTKRWRLDRLDYRYVKNDFTYDKNKARWVYDSTTGSSIVARDSFSSFVDGIELEFSPTVDPTKNPDLMDSQIVYNQVLTTSTQNPMFQYSLPKVPNPEESFQLYMDDKLKDMFPYGNKDYVLNYWQSPMYQSPPPMDQRKVANIMPLKGISNITLDPVKTSMGIIQFTDGSGNNLSGVMPGSETIKFDGIVQTAYEDYVFNTYAGLALASTHETNEQIVKYVAYQQPNLFDYGININLVNSEGTTPQKLTIPHNNSDTVLFEYESGRFKPAATDNPAKGDEYIIDYLVEGTFVSNEVIQTNAGMTWFEVNQYPIKFQNAIVSKNGIIINENVDYRVSYLTGRIILSEPLIFGDSITVSYQPLVGYKNGLTYEDSTSYCTSYGIVTPVTGINPPAFTLTNTAITPSILRIFNKTKNIVYDINDYNIIGSTVYLQLNPTNTSIITDLTDVVLIDYKFESDAVEHTPVQYINFYLEAGSDYIAFINQNSTNLFTADTFIRLTDVETAGNYLV